MSAQTYRVSWRGGHESGLDEGTSERLARALARFPGMVVTRTREPHFDAAHPAPPATNDEQLVEQVREAVAEGLALPTRNPAGKGNEA